MIFTVITRMPHYDTRLHACIYRGEFEEIRDILPPDVRDSYQVTANNFRLARKKVRAMFDKKAVPCVDNGIYNYEPIRHGKRLNQLLKTL